MFTLAKQSQDVARLVQGLPLRPSRSDAAGGDLQHPERAVQEPRRALGAGAADRHQGGVDGVLPRRRDDLGDRRAADRHASRDLSRADARAGSTDFELDTGKRKIKPYDPTVGKQIADMLRPSMGDQIPTDRRRRSPSRSAAAGGSPTRRPRPSCCEKAGFTKQRQQVDDAGRQAVHDHASWSRAKPRPVMTRAGTHDRAAVAPVRHRRQDRRGAGHAWSTAAPPATSTP